MAKPLLSIALALFLVPCPGRAEVDVPVACRIKNRPPGRCGWCSLETLARFQHLTVLYGLTDQHETTCSPTNLEESLNGTGIVYRIQYPGETSQAILHHAVSQGLGAAVGFRELFPGAGGHIVTLVDITDDTVKVIDPNDQDCRTRSMSIERFLYWWDGFALVLEPKLTEERALAQKREQSIKPKYGNDGPVTARTPTE
jgi:hypothetical protein